MSRFIDAAATSQVLSLAAMEEASRLGQRTADIDHLLLALTLDSDTAGQVLRALGVTIGSARKAVEAEQATQLASLGLRVESSAPQRIVFHETDGYEWSERAITILRRAGEHEGRAYSPSVLRELMHEPSGHIEAMLTHLGTSTEEVITRLDESEDYPEIPSQRVVRPGTISGTAEVFVPAPPEQVRQLLITPARMPEWDPTLGRIEDAPPVAQAGDTWRGHARTQRPDGKPIKVRPAFAAQQIELVSCDENRSIEWLLTYPDAAQASARRARIELEPAAGGTRLVVILDWERHPDRRRRPLLALPLRPFQRYLAWQQATQLGNGISRAFR